MGVSAVDVNNNSRNIVKNRTECSQILLHLQRLQHLVPTCPKDKPMNKLQLIQSVIDYIYDLEEVLNSSTDSVQDSSSDLEITSTMHNISTSDSDESDL